MEYFSIITGATVLIHTNGVYRQADLYARGSAIYAKVGNGFIKIGIGGATSTPRTRWAEFDAGEAAIITEKPGCAPVLEGMGDVREAAE